MVSHKDCQPLSVQDDHGELGCLSNELCPLLVEDKEKFVFNKQYLKNILMTSAQTLQLFEDTKPQEDLTHCSLQDDPAAELRAELALLQAECPALLRPVCLVVLGGGNGARAAAVAALLGEPLLPLQPPPDQLWPAVVVRGACEDFAVLVDVCDGLRRDTDLEVVSTEHGRHTQPPCLRELGIPNVEESAAWLNVGLNHPLLRGDQVRLLVAPSRQPAAAHRFLEDVQPVYLYCAQEGTALSQQEVCELTELHRITGGAPVLVWAGTDQEPDRPPPPPPPDWQGGLRLHWPHQPRGTRRPSDRSASEAERAVVASYCRPPPGRLAAQLTEIGYELGSRGAAGPASPPVEELRVCSQLVSGSGALLTFHPFLRTQLQLSLLSASQRINKALNGVLRSFILTAFDMAREIQITPRRLQYARQRETELYDSLMGIADRNQQQMSQVVNQTAARLRDQLLTQAELFQFDGLSDSGEVRSARQLQQCTAQIQNVLLSALNRAVAGQLLGSVDYMQERFVGTLQRCLRSLEAHDDDGHSEASDALKQILNSAYSVELSVETSSSVIASLWERLKQLLDVMPWKQAPCVDAQWRRRVATEMLDNINELRLSRIICAQLRERLRCAHEAFVRSMSRLEAQLTGQLEQTERHRLRVKKLHAPQVARLALQAAAYGDAARHGVPQLCSEIGRGQYGVVYSSSGWAGRPDWAVKSVIPPDDRHWNDLSMEYFYTRSLPEHDRIVNIRGIVIDYNYSQSRLSAALLLMDRLHSDLYLGIQDGLDLHNRLQIAMDVAQGARFLHSQGLIHRDIKLKNVLLDTDNRAKLSDLGFCKPEAMISGSVVGTPIHMAPELFSGKYDNGVDVYAFGVLLWYVFSNDVRMPDVYEQCDNKNALWECVKRGVRPARPRHCSDPAWCLVQSCWRGDPRQRPLFGVVELRLHELLSELTTDGDPHQPASDPSEAISCWS